MSNNMTKVIKKPMIKKLVILAFFLSAGVLSACNDKPAEDTQTAVGKQAKATLDKAQNSIDKANADTANKMQAIDNQ